LVIRVTACGVCGSDIKAQPFAPAGMVMGHEFGGEIVGAVSHCPSASYLGMGPAGGFAEYAAVPARHAFAVPAELPTVYSALVEPFAVGLHAVRSAEITTGDDVLIVGAGGVGLTTLAWVLRHGGARVTVADPDPQRRQTAAALGADVIASASDADTGAYDVVVECVGRPELLAACQPALRPRGRIVISGACAEPTPIEPITALLKELTVRYSVAYSIEDFRDVVAAFSTRAIDPAPMIGPSLGLPHIADAFDAVRTGQVQGRVLVSP
jgi:(R,R)-butanediol dehydrogenase / meso-butanediol dehydrogenase / diacetyl reductase